MLPNHGKIRRRDYQPVRLARIAFVEGGFDQTEYSFRISRDLAIKNTARHGECQANRRGFRRMAVLLLELGEFLNHSCKAGQYWLHALSGLLRSSSETSGIARLMRSLDALLNFSGVGFDGLRVGAMRGLTRCRRSGWPMGRMSAGGTPKNGCGDRSTLIGLFCHFGQDDPS